MEGALALTVPLGLAIGVTMGALGGGGAIVAVPVLVYLFGQDARTATTGSLVVVGTAALLGMLAHLRAGRVRFGQGAVFGVLGVAAAYVGSRLAIGVRDAVLLTSFAALLLVVAGVMTWRRRRRPRGHGAVGERPVVSWRSRPRVDVPRFLLLLVTASVVGLLTGFFGVGGGFAVVPALVLVLGLPMPVAVGTSLVVIAVNSAAALASRLGEISVDWWLIGSFTASAVVGTLLGSRVTARVPANRLNAAFTVLLVAVAVGMAVTSVPQL